MEPAVCPFTVIIILFVIVVVVRYPLFTAEITQLYVYRRSLFSSLLGVRIALMDGYI